MRTSNQHIRLLEPLHPSSSNLRNFNVTGTSSGSTMARTMGSSTWYQLTQTGRDEFDAYRTALRAMLEDG